jgi:hypothetical protein
MRNPDRRKLDATVLKRARQSRPSPITEVLRGQAGPLFRATKSKTPWYFQSSQLIRLSVRMVFFRNDSPMSRDGGVRRPRPTSYLDLIRVYSRSFAVEEVCAFGCGYAALGLFAAFQFPPFCLSPSPFSFPPLPFLFHLLTTPLHLRSCAVCYLHLSSQASSSHVEPLR